MTTGTLRDISALNGRDQEVGILDEVAGDFPEVLALPGRTIKGTTYKVTFRKNNPKGSFRAANAGVKPGAAGYYEKLVQCSIYENPIIVDKRVAQADEDGEADYLTNRSIEHVAGAMEGLAEQLYYGADDEANKGFVGLKDLGTDEMRINAAGTTAAKKTTVYLVRVGVDAVHWVYGQGAGLSVPDFVEQVIADPADPTKVIPALVSPMGLWIGLASGSTRSIVKIGNITDDAGKGFTDALVQAALELMPAGFRNNKAKLRILANGRSVGQLQTSRTAVNQVAYKAGAIADRPVESMGIQIIETDSIKIGATEAETFA
tara:strand:+ start:2350 stop:3303 length:954 start_codon:yes stop_codon:yes gene_type:complete